MSTQSLSSTGGDSSRAASRKLSRDQLGFFRANGFLIVDHVFVREELDELDLELEERYQERLKDPVIARTEEKRNNIHSLGADSERSRSLASDPRVLGLIEDLVQPGIALFSAKLISKGPHEPNNVCHWHQDEAYWYRTGISQCRMSLWVPLLDTDKRNGCLRVVPATHQDGIRDHEARSSRDHGACRLSFLPGELELPNTVYCEIPAGSVVLFSNQVYHSSLGNHSDNHRRAFILSYNEATVAGGKDRDYRILRPAS